MMKQISRVLFNCAQFKNSQFAFNLVKIKIIYGLSDFLVSNPNRKYFVDKTAIKKANKTSEHQVSRLDLFLEMTATHMLISRDERSN